MKKTYKIQGMHCKSCAKTIEMELEEKSDSINVDFNNKLLEIETDLSDKEIKSIINKLGYKIE